MTGGRIAPSTMRNPVILGSLTESRQITNDPLNVAMHTIRAALDRGDLDAGRQAWIDVGALLGILPAGIAPKSSAKRTRKRTA